MSPAGQHAISSPQHLERCSSPPPPPNTSATPNCLFIIEITGDFSRIKWQMIKFSLWLRGGRWWHYNGAIDATLPSSGDPSTLQTDYILLRRNIWNSEQAADPDRNPGISRTTPVHGCYGICQSATFRSKAPSAEDHIDMLRKEREQKRGRETTQMCGATWLAPNWGGGGDLTGYKSWGNIKVTLSRSKMSQVVFWLFVTQLSRHVRLLLPHFVSLTLSEMLSQWASAILKRKRSAKRVHCHHTTWLHMAWVAKELLNLSSRLIYNIKSKR